MNLVYLETYLQMRFIKKYINDAEIFLKHYLRLETG